MKYISGRLPPNSNTKQARRRGFDTQTKSASDYFTQTSIGSHIHTRAMDPANRPPEIEKFHQQLKAWTVLHLKREYCVLEAGCGTGAVLRWISPEVKLVVGIDNAHLKVDESQDMVLREHLMNVQVMMGDFFHLHRQFERHPFDVICLYSNTLGNFPGMEAKLLRALAKGLKKDGQILLQLYGDKSIQPRWNFYSTIGWPNLRYNKDEKAFRAKGDGFDFVSLVFDEPKICQIVNEAGLELAEMKKVNIGYFVAVKQQVY